MFSIDEMHFLLCESSSNIKCQNTNKERLILYNNANVFHIFLHGVGERRQSSLVFF